MSQDYIFITDLFIRTLFRFDDYGYIKVSSEPRDENERAMQPFGAVCDENANVYIVDAINKRILQYTSQLEFKMVFYFSNYKLPVDVKLSPDNQELIVLFKKPHFISFFNLKGRKIRDLFVKSDTFSNPHFFCLDLSGNFIVSNLSENTVSIVNSQGILEYKLLLSPINSVSTSVLGIAMERNNIYIVHCFSQRYDSCVSVMEYKAC